MRAKDCQFVFELAARISENGNVLTLTEKDRSNEAVPRYLIPANSKDSAARVTAVSG